MTIAVIAACAFLLWWGFWLPHKRRRNFDREFFGPRVRGTEVMPGVPPIEVSPAGPGPAFPSAALWAEVPPLSEHAIDFIRIALEAAIDDEKEPERYRAWFQEALDEFNRVYPR